MKIRFFLLLLSGILALSPGFAQVAQDQSKWTFEARRVKGEKNAWDLVVHVHLPEGWHIYSMNPGGDGMEIAPEIKFEENKAVKLNGPVKEEGKLTRQNFEGVDSAINLFSGDVDYVQKAVIAENTTIKGTYIYQICNDHMCLPPTTKPFTITVNQDGKENKKSSKK